MFDRAGSGPLSGVAKSAKPAGAKFYQLADGDTLDSIASKFGLAPRELADFNRLTGKLKRGDVLMIPTRSGR